MRERKMVTRRPKFRRYPAREWSPEERAFLYQYYENYNTGWIANQLGRTVKAIQVKAYEECLAKSSFYRHRPYLQKFGHLDAFQKHCRG